MKTFIFGGTRDQSEAYKIRNFLFSAAMVRDSRCRVGAGTCEVHLVGTYKHNPQWEAVRAELSALRNFGMVTIHIEEWAE